MFTASIGLFIFGLLAAIAGGAVGAAIGGNYAFVLTGFCVLASWGMFAATGSTFGFDYLAFGPFMGPHIAFASGVAGAIYARYKGYMDDGKDVNSPLAGLGRADVLCVGSIFGIFGYLLQIGITQLPWFGSHTDSVALTVITSGVLARIVFGGDPGKGLFKGSLHTPHLYNTEATGLLGKIKPGPNGRWLEWQEKPGPLFAIGSLFGIFAGGSALFLAANVPGAAGVAPTFAFGISAVIILFLITNRNMPVQHHVTITAGLAAVQFFPILLGSKAAEFAWTPTANWDSHTWLMAAFALVIAALAGLFAAFLCEFFARLWYNRGTSHVDPPAAAIWICNTVVVSLALLF